MKGEDLTQWRKERKITRKKLADLTCYSTSALMRMEKQKQKLVPKKLALLIELLKITPK